MWNVSSRLTSPSVNVNTSEYEVDRIAAQRDAAVPDHRDGVALLHQPVQSQFRIGTAAAVGLRGERVLAHQRLGAVQRPHRVVGQKTT